MTDAFCASHTAVYDALYTVYRTSTKLNNNYYNDSQVVPRGGIALRTYKYYVGVSLEIVVGTQE